MSDFRKVENTMQVREEAPNRFDYLAELVRLKIERRLRDITRKLQKVIDVAQAEKSVVENPS
jgi:hypothetical protein